MNLFVPGRICLFGEHSDWAGRYRDVNPDIEKGHTIIAGTNQGVHAEVKAHPSKLVLWSTTDAGERKGPFEIPMERAALRAEASKGHFFSYAAGVASEVLADHDVGGLEIDNYRTDLPIKKGLSSSAAICVLVARAFSRVYDLGMDVRDEMEYAYRGEIATPSECGRMDQGCAYGDTPIMMIYDGDRLDVERLPVGGDVHLIIVDLCAGKDTMEILSKLNQCYPHPHNDVQRAVHEYLGPLNRKINVRARGLLERGDVAGLGALMTEAQAAFDRHLTPACPSQLTAPALHAALAHEALQPYVHGGKGIGSQGDGSAQFVARDAECQHRAVEILEGDLGLSCLKLVIGATREVHDHPSVSA